MKYIFFIFLFFFTVPSAFADLLFIDLNFSSQEVDAAKKAAQVRGEKLIVYPEVKDEDRKIINDKKEALHLLEVEGQSLLAKLGAETDPEKKKIITNEINDRTVKWTAIDESIQNFIKEKDYLHTPEKLKALTSSHNIDNGSFSSLIISAHHSGKSFFGYAGGFYEQDFQDMVSLSPKAFEATRSIYLWGCYTATKTGIVSWKAIIPSAYVIVGWEGSAPKDDKPINRELLLKMLTKEKELSDKTTLVNAASLFRSIPKIKDSSAAFCVGKSYVSNEDQEVFNENFSCPKDNLDYLQSKKAEIEKYIKAEEANYEDVPKSTQHSLLREAYTLGRQMEHCSDLRMIPSSDLDRLIKLIFDRQVRKNFSNLFKEEILECNDILKKLGAPIEALVPDMKDGNTTRKVVLKSKAALEKYILENNKIEPELFKKLDDMKNRIRHIIENHDCTEPIWVENVSVKSLKENLDETCAVNSADPITNQGRHDRSPLDALWGL